MKKILLSVIALFAAVSMYAQQEEGGEEPTTTGDFIVVSMNVDNALGLDSENGSPLAKDLALYDEPNIRTTMVSNIL